jgi:mannose-6-phosphate isomerase-like protein (cupin superfamily)
MKITKVKDTPIKDTPHKVDARGIYDLPDAQLTHISLLPGEALKPHITPVDVFMYILEGTATVGIGEEVEEVEADSVVESPKGIVHYIANKSDKPVRILVGKTPRPLKVRPM